MAASTNPRAQCHFIIYYHKSCGHDSDPGILVRCNTHWQMQKGIECDPKGPLRAIEHDERCPGCKARCYSITHHHQACGHDSYPGILVRCETHARERDGSSCAVKGPVRIINVSGWCQECGDGLGQAGPQQHQQTAAKHWDRVHARELKKALRKSEKEAPAYARAGAFEDEEVARQMSLEGTEGDFEKQLEKARMESLESAFEYFRMRRDQGVGSEYAGSTMSGESSRRPQAGRSRSRVAPTIYEEDDGQEYEASPPPPQRPSRLGSLFRKAAEKLGGGNAAHDRVRAPADDGSMDSAAPSRTSRRSRKTPSRATSAAPSRYQSETGSLHHGSEFAEQFEEEDAGDASSTNTLHPAQHPGHQYEDEQGGVIGAHQQWPPQPAQRPSAAPYPASESGATHTAMPAQSAPAFGGQSSPHAGQAHPTSPQQYPPYTPNVQQPQVPMAGPQPAFAGYPSQPQETWQFPAQPLRSPSPAATLHRVMSQHGDEESRRQGLFTNHPHRPPTAAPASAVESNAAGLGMDDEYDGDEEEGAEGEWESETDHGTDVGDDATAAGPVSTAPSAAPSALHTDQDGYGGQPTRKPAHARSKQSRR